jgi:PAS domain S-box-containing protein
MSDHPADLAKADYARGALAPDLDLLRASVEAIDEAILITGPDLDPPGPRIVYANPAFTRMTGYELAEVLGRSPRLLQGPNTSRATLDELRGALKDGRSFRGESINYRKDGTEYRIEWLIAPVRRNGVITHWMSAQRDVTERARIAEKMHLLAREVDHRAKNALAAVQSILQMTPGESVAAYRAAVIGRVSALARAQTLLVEQDWNGASLQALIQGEVAPFRGLGQQVNLDGPPLLLPPTMVQPMSMALHELATNAVKHGALSAPGGRVLITWTVERQGKDTLQLHWREIGGPAHCCPAAAPELRHAAVGQHVAGSAWRARCPSLGTDGPGGRGRRAVAECRRTETGSRVRQAPDRERLAREMVAALCGPERQGRARELGNVGGRGKGASVALVLHDGRSSASRHLDNGRHEQIQLDSLPQQDRLGTAPNLAEALAREVVAREHHHGQARLHQAQRPQKLSPRQAGHLPVHHHEVRAVRTCHLERLFAFERKADLQVLRPEQVGHEHADQRLIVDHQHACVDRRRVLHVTHSYIILSFM